MLAKTIDKFSGILSLVWAIGGYVLIRCSLASFVGFLFFVWLGIGLLLVIGGLRRGNLMGRIGAICGVAVFLVYLEPLHGIGRCFANLFRKDEYAFPYRGAPECRIHILLRNREQIATFENILERFAVSHSLPKCNNKHYVFYSGPAVCTFKNEHVAIWDGAGYVRMLPHDKKYPIDEFKRLSDSLVADLRAAFGEEVEMSFKEAEKQ